MAGVGDRLRIGAAGTRDVEGGLVLDVELFHREQALLAARGKRVEHDALQAMVLGIVVRLAEDHVSRTRCTVEELVRLHEARSAHVPGPADQRMLAGAERSSAGGEDGQAEGDEKFQAKIAPGDPA